jgi:hypothetical protein
MGKGLVRTVEEDEQKEEKEDHLLSSFIGMGTSFEIKGKMRRKKRKRLKVGEGDRNKENGGEGK